MWSFRLSSPPAYEHHQVHAQVNRLQMAEGKLLSAAAGSQVLTDLATVELRHLLATLSTQIGTVPQAVVNIPQRTVHVKLHTHRVLQDLEHRQRRQNLAHLGQNVTASPLICMNSTSSSAIHDNDAVQQDPRFLG
ncbi:hypothetical protein [Absidia glauca]|uniref:Uncharacterized protein n=1 Tax=Absidia glauca TaxID=4829 RepID=A0A163JES5_ABSGL|nr:hypothetical protein [Absidia glauca]